MALEMTNSARDFLGAVCGCPGSLTSGPGANLCLFKGFSLFFHLCQERKSSQLEDPDASAASTILYTHWDSRDKGHPSFFSYENIG